MQHRSRFHRLITAALSAAVLTGAAVVVHAQTRGPDTGPVPKDQAPGAKKNLPRSNAQPPAAAPKRPRATIPETAAKRDRLLAELYPRLATASNEENAKRISDVIERIWLTSGSDTVDVLMDRALRAANGNKPEVALELLNKVVVMAPDFAEGFNRRAYVYYSMNNYVQALGDLRRVLALEPNHFKALDAMGQILKEIEEKKPALAVYAKLLEIAPYWPGAKQAYDELAHEVEGRAL
jgi:tetratricopeptide (TPR) repeat protein